MKTTRVAVALSVTGLLALGACGNGESGDGASRAWQYADYLPPGTGHVRAMDQALFDPVEEEGVVELDKYYQEALLGATDILGGVADGRADIGFTTNLYYPGELPLTYLGSVPFLTDNAEAHTRTFNELYQTNEDFRAEFEAQGVHVLTFVPLSGTIIGATEEWSGPADMTGRDIRAAGYMTMAIEAAGGNVVAITAPEIYDAMDRGIINAFTSYPFGTAISTSLHEVSPYFIDSGAGMYILGILIVNRDEWDRLSDESRAAFEDRTEDFVEQGLEEIRQEDEESCQIQIDNGGSVVVWSDAEKEAFRELIGDDIVDAWRADTIGRGVDEAVVDAFYADYQDLFDRFDSESDYRSGIQLCQ